MGFPLWLIPKLEKTEYEDWLDAAKALNLEDKLHAMNAGLLPRAKDPNGEFDKLKFQQSKLLLVNFKNKSEKSVYDIERQKKVDAYNKKHGNNQSDSS